MTAELKITIGQEGGQAQPSSPITNPPRQFTREQWEQIPPADRMAVSQQMNMAPPSGVVQEPLARPGADREALLNYRRAKLDERTRREIAQYGGQADVALNSERQQRDEDYAAKQERRQDERARREEDRKQRQQQRDEDYAAKQERMEERRAQKDQERAEKRQQRDEDWLTKRENRDARRQERDDQRQERDAQRQADQQQRQSEQAWGQIPGVGMLRRFEPLANAMGYGDKFKILTRGPMPQATGAATGADAAAGAATSAAGGADAAAGAAGAAGAAEAGGGMLAGAAALAGPIAAGVAVVYALKMVRQKAVDMADGMGEATASLAQFKDGSSRVHEFGDVLQRVAKTYDGVLPTAAASFVSSVAKMDDAVKSTAQRLGQYNGQLAAQNAQQEVAELMRDLRRAQQFGEQTASANQARFEMEQKLADITDRFMPVMLQLSEGAFTKVGDILTVLEPIADLLSLMLEKFVTMVGFLDKLNPVSQTLSGIAAVMKEFKDDRNASASEQQWTELINMLTVVDRGPGQEMVGQPQVPFQGQ